MERGQQEESQTVLRENYKKISYHLGQDFKKLRDTLDNILSGDAQEQNIRAAKLRTDFSETLTKSLHEEIQENKQVMKERFR